MTGLALILAALIVGTLGSYMLPSAFRTTAAPAATMSVSADTAITTAQRYLDTALPGTQAANTADAFYGYYTIEITRNGQPIGMLSVNGATGAVFLHTWHGTFVGVAAPT